MRDYGFLPRLDYRYGLRPPVRLWRPQPPRPSGEPAETVLARARELLRDPHYLRRRLAELDEQRLGRRRLASEERRYRRLQRQLAAAERSTTTEGESDVTTTTTAAQAAEQTTRPPVSVREPDMYTRENPRFLHDLYLSEVTGDPLARERIARHQAYEVERYAVSSSGLGGIIPPAYLVDLYARAQRFGRVFADQVRHEPLPDGMTVYVPRLTAGTTAAIQASENTAVATADPAEADLAVPVRTVAGMTEVSRQTLERGAYSEQILFEDLVARYHQVLDTQLLNGSGASGQHLGVLQQSGVSLATVSSWSSANAWSAVVGVIAQINQWAATVGAPADKIVMHPRRWGAFLGLLDSAGRPLFGLGGQPNYAPLGTGEASGYGQVGQIAGLPVYTDANIPTNLGAGTNEDRIIVMASQAVILWERPEGPITLAIEEAKATQLTVQLVCYGYSAFSAGRYPAAVGVISGAGLV